MGKSAPPDLVLFFYQLQRIQHLFQYQVNPEPQHRVLCCYCLIIIIISHSTHVNITFHKQMYSSVIEGIISLSQ